MSGRRLLRTSLLAVLCALAVPALAQAEAWTQVSSGLPLRPTGVNRSGAVVGTIGSSGGLARFTRAGGLVRLDSGDPSCTYWQTAGITDTGIVLASAYCGNDARSFAFGPSSTVGSATNLPPGIIPRVQGDGRFVESGSGSTPQALTGVASLDAGGSAVVGTTPITGSFARGINPTGDTLTSTYVDGSFTFYVNGSARSSFVVTAEDDSAFGPLPDASFVQRRRGQPLSVIGSGGSSAPLALTTAAGSTVDDDRFLPGANAGAKLFGVTSGGGGLPAGQAGIVAWGDPTQPARLLPILSPVTAPAEPPYPLATSADGAYLALSDGQLWFDPDAVAPVASVDPAVQQAIAQAEQPRPVVTPPPGTRLANPSPAVKEVARGEQRYWDRQALRAGIDAGQFVSATSGGGGPPAAGAQAQIAMAIYAAFQQRLEFWSTVALDPPDPQWRTIASAPAVRIARLGLQGVGGKGRAALRTQLDGQLRLAAAERCAADAINRGSTAIANGRPDVAAAQYRAGSACLRAAAPVATALPASAARAASALATQRRAARRGTPKAVSKARYAKGVDAALRRLGRVVALPAASVAELRTALTRKVPKAAVPDLGGSLRALAQRSAGQVTQLQALAVELDRAAAGA